MEPAAESLVEKHVVQSYWEISMRTDGIAWLSRLKVPYPSIADVHASYDQFIRAVDDWLLDRRIKEGLLGTRARVPMAWLTDMRQAPDLRNDPEFEAVVKQRRPELLERSPALGILVNTSAGQMQLNRITREKDMVLGVFSNPDEMVSWLLRRMHECFPDVRG